MNVPDAATSPSVVGGAASQAGRAIAVAGEALVDFVLEPGDGTTPHLGGCSFNAARTLGWLGLPPVFIGRLSRDRYGRALRSALEESGVILEGVVATDAPTTFARVDGTGMAPPAVVRAWREPRWPGCCPRRHERQCRPA